MNYVIEGSGALVNEKGEETALKTGDIDKIQSMPGLFRQTLIWY